jgi:hypothetical protein
MVQIWHPYLKHLPPHPLFTISGVQSSLFLYPHPQKWQYGQYKVRNYLIITTWANAIVDQSKRVISFTGSLGGQCIVDKHITASWVSHYLSTILHKVFNVLVTLLLWVEKLHKSKEYVHITSVAVLFHPQQ